MVGTNGGDYTFFNVTNTGPTCSLRGYPTVRIYDSAGALVGGPAPHRAGSAPVTIVLKRDEQAQFEIYDVHSPVLPCGAGHDNTLQTYLPGQSIAQIVSPYG